MIRTRAICLFGVFINFIASVVYPTFIGSRRGTQRNCVTKILPIVRVNFLVRFASKLLFYWEMTGNPLELLRKFFGAVRAIFWLCGSFLAPDFMPCEPRLLWHMDCFYWGWGGLNMLKGMGVRIWETGTYTPLVLAGRVLPPLLFSTPALYTESTGSV